MGARRIASRPGLLPVPRRPPPGAVPPAVALGGADRQLRQPREAVVPRGRLHQGGPDSLLPGDLSVDAAVPARPAADAHPVPRRHPRRELLPEAGRRTLRAVLGAHRADGGRRGTHPAVRLRGRGDALLPGQPRHHPLPPLERTGRRSRAPRLVHPRPGSKSRTLRARHHPRHRRARAVRGAGAAPLRQDQRELGPARARAPGAAAGPRGGHQLRAGARRGAGPAASPHRHHRARGPCPALEGLRRLSPERPGEAPGRSVLGASAPRRSGLDAAALGRGDSRTAPAPVHRARCSSAHGAPRDRSLPRRARRGTGAGDRALAPAEVSREAGWALGSGRWPHPDGPLGRSPEGERRTSARRSRDGLPRARGARAEGRSGQFPAPGDAGGPARGRGASRLSPPHQGDAGGPARGRGASRLSPPLSSSGARPASRGAAARPPGPRGRRRRPPR